MRRFVLIVILDPKIGELNQGTLSPDGARAMTTGGHDRPRLWNAETGALIAAFGPEGANVRFSPDGRLVATTGGTDTTADGPAVQLWDTATARLAGTIRVAAGASNAIFSPDGRRIFVTGSRQPELWDVATLQRVQSFDAPTSISDAIFSPDGSLAVLSGQPPESTRSAYWLADLATGQLTRVAIDGAGFDARFCVNGRSMPAAHHGSGTSRRRSLTCVSRSRFPTPRSPSRRSAPTARGSSSPWTPRPRKSGISRTFA